MKRIITLAALALSLGVFANTSRLAAETRDKLTAEVPFSFRAAHQTLPAGHYIVGRASGQGSVFTLVSKEDSSARFVMGGGKDVSSGEPKLVFHKIRNTYFLAGIGTNNGEVYVIPPSAQEKEMRSGEKVALAYVNLNVE